jgi:hypothetical protein
MADNSKVVPKLLDTIGSCIAGKMRLGGTGGDTPIGLDDLCVKSATATKDRDGDVLIILLSNGQSLKVRATPFAKATV